MPELPEIAAHAERLGDGWTGATLTAVEPLSVTALKTADPPVDAGVGAPLAGVGRRGKYLLLQMGADPPITYVLHLMQGGGCVPMPTLPVSGPAGGCCAGGSTPPTRCC